MSAPTALTGPIQDWTDPPSDAEIGFLWRHLHSGASLNNVFEAMRERWGMCERHTIAMLAVAASMPRSGMHSVTTLYGTLIDHACALVSEAGPTRRSRCEQALRAVVPCPMCALGLTAASSGVVHRGWLAWPRGLELLRACMAETRPFWSAFVCGVCAGTRSKVLCRSHLLAALGAEPEGIIDEQKPFLAQMQSHLEQYRLVFAPDYATGEPADERGAVIAAAGWCSGWGELLRMRA